VGSRKYDPGRCPTFIASASRTRKAHSQQATDRGYPPGSTL